MAVTVTLHEKSSGALNVENNIEVGTKNQDALILYADYTGSDCTIKLKSKAYIDDATKTEKDYYVVERDLEDLTISIFEMKLTADGQYALPLPMPVNSVLQTIEFEGSGSLEAFVTVNAFVQNR